MTHLITGIEDFSVKSHAFAKNTISNTLSADEVKKLEQDLQKLAIKLLSLPKEEQAADFRDDPEAKDIIDELKVYFPILDNSRDPYLYANKDEIIAEIVEIEGSSSQKNTVRKGLAEGMIQCFNNYYGIRESDKMSSQKKMEETNALLKDLDNLVSKFLALPKDQQEINFRNDPEAKALIDKLVKHFPALDNPNSPYQYNNKNDVLSFIMQRGNDFNSISNENMMIIQFKSDEQKQAWEIIQKMLTDYLDLEKSYTKISTLHP